MRRMFLHPAWPKCYIEVVSGPDWSETIIDIPTLSAVDTAHTWTGSEDQNGTKKHSRRSFATTHNWIETACNSAPMGLAGIAGRSHGVLNDRHGELFWTDRTG